MYPTKQCAGSCRGTSCRFLSWPTVCFVRLECLTACQPTHSVHHICSMLAAPCPVKVNSFHQHSHSSSPTPFYKALTVQWTVFSGLRMPAAIRSVSLWGDHVRPARWAVRKGASPRESMPPRISCSHSGEGWSVWMNVCLMMVFLWFQLVLQTFLETFWGHKRKPIFPVKM